MGRIRTDKSCGGASVDSRQFTVDGSEWGMSEIRKLRLSTVDCERNAHTTRTCSVCEDTVV